MQEFQRFDPAKCHFPGPRVPLLPTPALQDVTFGAADVIPSGALEGEGVRHFARGRYALAAAYRSAGIGPGTALLAPAYHCRTMLDPALAQGGDLRFYALNVDLTPKIDSIEAEVAAQGAVVKALIVPHYFGVEQPAPLMRNLQAFCARHGIALVEDCSHAWQVALQRGPACAAGIGNFVVASPYKFFACADGGTLWGNPSSLPQVPQTSPGLLDEARALKALLATRAGSAHLPAPNPQAIAQARAGDRGAELRELDDQPSRLYDRALEGRSSLSMSRWAMRRSKLSSVVQRRRNHYCAWIDAVSVLPGCRALFPELPETCAPYMFPLLISSLDPFFTLKQLGMPIWRWDEMAVSPCPVASEFRLHLIHLPCHQSLTTEQMCWMTTTVAEVLA